MKICIWCTKIFDLGGTKRVVTLLANELVKEHDVTIMVYQDRFKEDRNMYHTVSYTHLEADSCKTRGLYSEAVSAHIQQSSH